MSFKKFSSKDLVYNVVKTNPKSVFSIKQGIVYYQHEPVLLGAPGFEDSSGRRNNINHVSSGHINLHEMNVDRPRDHLIYRYLVRSSQGEALPPISSESELNDIPLGQEMVQLYPMSASINRIFIPAGAEANRYIDGPNGRELERAAHANKKYIRSLRNVIETQGNVSSGLGYGDLGTQRVNMICIPGIFYGSKINPGSINLEYYFNNSRIGKVQDSFSDGRLMEVSSGDNPTYRQVGIAIYNQGLLLLTASHSLDGTLTQYGTGAPVLSGRDASRWVNFGSGLPQVGEALANVAPGAAPTYKISFEGTNNIPTLSMYAYSELGSDNYSHNPTFLTSSRSETIRYNSSSFYQEEVNIKKTNKSDYKDAQEEFENVTYISKIGIYDRFKNLIAIASLSRPIKKTEKRDYMFKIGIDF